MHETEKLKTKQKITEKLKSITNLMPFCFILGINLRPWTFRRHCIHQNSSIYNIYIHKIKKH